MALTLQNNFLNIFDGLILQLMVMIVMIGTFDFLQPVTTEMVLILVIAPLIVLSIVGASGKFFIGEGDMLP